MRKTPNAVNNREQGKEGMRVMYGRRKGGTKRGTVEGGREEGRDRKGGEVR